VADMDELGIDHQILSLTTPGVELLELPQARELAERTNDNIARACRRFGIFKGVEASTS
jgi:5-carboxyvanillate decarboxylase